MAETKQRSTPMIALGASVEAVAEARRAIMAILECSEADQDTKRVALQTLSTLCNVSGTTISNCTITG